MLGSYRNKSDSRSEKSLKAVYEGEARWSPLKIWMVAIVGVIATPHSSLAQNQEFVVHYDKQMVPHIYGETDEAAFYALGYTQMLDFPVGTLVNLWRYSGRYAEFVGQKKYLSEPTALEIDRRNLHWELPQLADRQQAQLDPQIRGLLQAYVRGVNDGRAWWRAPASDEPGRSRIAQLVGDGVAKPMYVDPLPLFLNERLNTGSVSDDVEPLKVLERFLDPLEEINVRNVLCLGIAVNAGPPIYISGVPSASNGWAISAGAVPFGGGAITLSDSHLPVNTQSYRPYLIDVHGSDFHVTGLTMPGFPCVYIGYNDHISWHLTGLPSRAPQMYAGTTPVTRGAWSIEPRKGGIQPSTIECSGYPFLFGEQIKTDRLKQLQYYDPQSDELKDAEFEPLHWIDPAPPGGFPNYPVTSGDPCRLEALIFERAAFQETRSPWELFIRLARATNASTQVDAILDEVVFLFGRGNNLMVVDRDGFMRYDLMSHVPIQGFNAQNVLKPWLDPDASQVMPYGVGNLWEGFHDYAVLPKLHKSGVGVRRIWINNNATVDLVSEDQPIDPTSFPDYMVEHESLGNWRQHRVRRLTDTGLITEDMSASFANDTRDNWSVAMWPFFEAAWSLESGSGLVGAEETVHITEFVNWVNTYKGEQEDESSDDGNSFDAHVFSRVTVYSTLLRSIYEADPIIGQLLPPQSTLSIDADLHANNLVTPADLAANAWLPIRHAMVEALSATADLWSRGTALGDLAAGEPGGLQNQALLEVVNERHGPAAEPLNVNPWEDFRYRQELGPSMGVTRWGHVHYFVATPHNFRPLPAPNTLLFRVSLFSAMRPRALRLIPSFDYPVYTAQTPGVFPLRGVRDSVFTSFHEGYNSSHDGLHPSGAQVFYYLPHTAGSQALLSVQMPGPGASSQVKPKGRFLTVLGATELTTQVPADHHLKARDRFSPTSLFAQGVWTKLETGAGSINSMRQLSGSYVP